jgi:purine nucleosidase
MNMTMVGWDISLKYAHFDTVAAETLRATEKTMAHFVVDIQGSKTNFTEDTTGKAGFDLPDPIATAVALDRTVAIDIKHLYAEVILGEGLTRGQTVIDHLNVLNKEPNMHVVFAASREKFLKMLHDSFE